METNSTPWAKSRKSIIDHRQLTGVIKPVALFIILLLLWSLVPSCLQYLDNSAGSIDQSIWLLVVLSLICFMLVATICWWLLKHFWKQLGLVPIKFMVLQFNTLTIWQQIIFYWASYALLILTALGCLVALC